MRIGIIDYGAGNLRSVAKALEYCGAKTHILSRPHEIAHMDKIVLPGVGAFGHAMSALTRLELLDALREYIQGQKPFLGICLGMQVLFSTSEESSGVPGLGLFAGEVRRFPRCLKVPHLGWNQVYPKNESTLFKDLPEQPFFYFAHSYYVHAVDSECISASTDYGERYAVAVENGHIFGIQFHPEKSQRNGLILLRNFINL